MNRSCKNCGGALEIYAAKKIAVCPYCDTTFPLSQIEDMETAERTRLHWDEMIRTDPQRQRLQEAWLQNANAYQKAQKKLDGFRSKLALPLQIVSIGALFISTLLCVAAFCVILLESGTVWDFLLDGTIALLFFAVMMGIPILCLWLVWRFQNRLRQGQCWKGKADFYQKELQIWSMVHSQENYCQGTIEEEDYLRAAQARQAAMEATNPSKDTRWKLALQIGLPILLGFLMGLNVETTPM